MINVGGFLFEDETIAAQAKKEEEGILFIKEKSSLSNPEVVFKLYKTVLQQKLFVTPVGLRFLMELQSVLMESSSIPKEEIPAIDTSVFYKAVTAESEKTATDSRRERVGRQTAQRINAMAKQKQDYKRPFHIALFFAIIFGLSIIGMFAIVEMSRDNVTILNYREKIINQYEVWEIELDSEEERLKEWESELEERENALENKK